MFIYSSNIPEEKKLQFELVQGQTEQTNKWHTFVLEPEADSAVIKLGNHLDYEKITDYTLTVRIQVRNTRCIFFLKPFVCKILIQQVVLLLSF